MRSTGDCGVATGWGRLETRDNALNAVRLLLACLVVVGHAYVLGYGQPPPVAGIHERAVEGFFTISGFLIAASRARLAIGPFLWRRALRIYPGLWGALLVTAVVIAPIGAAIAGDDYSWTDAASYVVSNAAAWFQQWGIGGGPSGVPFPGVWNGSLWTLTYELGCYIGFGLLVGAVRHRAAPAAVGVLAVTTSLLVLDPAVMQVFVVAQGVRLAGFFAAGALMFHLRDRVPHSAPWAVTAGLVVVSLWLVGARAFIAIAPLAVAYLLLWLSSTLPTRIGSRNDISYGMYVYAFPVQQLLVVAGFPSLMAPALLVVASLVFTAPLAGLSWAVLERRCLSIRGLPGSWRVGDSPPEVGVGPVV